MEATMLRLKRTQRELLADKLPDTANLALGALVFGQFLAASFSIALLILGMALWTLVLSVALHFAEDV